MGKNIDVGDILDDARNCIECVWMAAADLLPEDREPLRAVVSVARQKIEEAIARIDECPVLRDVSTLPVPPRPRTKRKGT